MSRRPLTIPQSRTAHVGQAVTELLILLGAALVVVLLLTGPVAQRLRGLLEGSSQQMAKASSTLHEVTIGPPPWAGEREQEGPPGVPELPDKDRKETTVATGPKGWTRPSSGGSSGGGGGGSGGGGGGGGGGSGNVGGGASPSPPDQPAPPEVPGAPEIPIFAPNPVEQALIDAAKAVLLDSSITVRLFDFFQGQMVTRAVADIARGLSQNGVPMMVADLEGALAAVIFNVRADGTFARTSPVRLVFDRRILAGATKEIAAGVLAHEAWHVQQLFTGIHDDFTHYPRVVDLEYEAFVVGAAVWDAVKGSQSERSLNAGSACVAQGEARCKEILVTDFGYPTGSRRG